MEKGKSILREIKEFLEYLGKNHENSKNKSWENLKKKFGEKRYQRLYSLCQERGYISNFSHGKGETRYYEIILTSIGLAFLEEQERANVQLKQTDAQNFLTLALVIFALIQGIIVLLYYYFDLLIRGNTFAANSIFFVGMIIFLYSLFGMAKLSPKTKEENFEREFWIGPFIKSFLIVIPLFIISLRRWLDAAGIITLYIIVYFSYKLIYPKK